MGRWKIPDSWSKDNGIPTPEPIPDFDWRSEEATPEEWVEMGDFPR